MVTKVEKVVYRAHATSTGGRDGTSKTSDGLLNVKLTVPREMGGAGGGVARFTTGGCQGWEIGATGGGAGAGGCGGW